MNYENKYNEALERARELSKTITGANYEYIFPELKESKSERIKKVLVDYFKRYKGQEERGGSTMFCGIPTDDILEWIEKQDKSAEINPDEIIEECHQDNADHIIDIVTAQEKPSEWSKEDKTELKESMDEKIKKDIKQHFLHLDDTFPDKAKWIAWLEKQDEKKIAWSEEDENGLGDALWAIKQARTIAKNENEMGGLWYAERWLKSLKDRIQSKQNNKLQGKSALEAIKEEKVDKVEPKFKIKYAGNEYNVLEVKDIAGVTFYGIEDEPNHIDYIKAENCERVDGYNIKESGSLYPTKSAMFSKQNPIDKVEPKFKVED